MAKSSINFAKASSGGLQHNDRSHSPDYLLPKEHRLANEVDFSANEADKKMTALYAEAKENYQEHTGQKLQATSYKWEAVINLNKEHTLKDVQKLTKDLEKETGFTSVQIAIHRDEGRVEKDKKGKDVPIYNNHAHVTFFTLDRKTGVNLYRKDITAKQRKEIEKEIFSNNKDIKKGEAGSVERKRFNKLVNEKKQEKNYKVMDSKRLSKIQTLTAKSLNMQRGKVSVKEEAEKLGVDQDLNPAEHLKHKAFKKVIQEKEKLNKELVKLKELKEELSKKREELKESGAERETYAKFEQISKELKEERKEKNLTHEKLDIALKKIDELKTDEQKTKDENTELKKENLQLKEENKTLKEKYNDLKQFVQEIPNKLLENAKKTYKEILEKVNAMNKEKENQSKNDNLEKQRRLKELYKQKEEIQKNEREK